MLDHWRTVHLAMLAITGALCDGDRAATIGSGAAIKKAGAHDAGGADEDEVRHMVRVLERVRRCQVAAHAVPDQHHLVDAHALPPRREGSEEELLRLRSIARRPMRPACAI